VGQRVRVVGQDDVFIVIRVDRCRYAADLVQMHGARQVETGVSLLAIRPISAAMSGRDHSETILQTAE